MQHLAGIEFSVRTFSDRGSYLHSYSDETGLYMEAWRYNDATPEIFNALKLPSDDEKTLLEKIPPMKM